VQLAEEFRPAAQRQRTFLFIMIYILYVYICDLYTPVFATMCREQREDRKEEENTELNIPNTYTCAK